MVGVIDEVGIAAEQSGDEPLAELGLRASPAKDEVEQLVGGGASRTALQESVQLFSERAGRNGLSSIDPVAGPVAMFQ